MTTEGKTNNGGKRTWRHPETVKFIRGLCQLSVFVLSILLIVYISYDTFMEIPFMENSRYMTFQLWVCIIFLAIYFIDIALADNPWGYAKNNIIFFLISVPYINIINYFQIPVAEEVAYYLRFIPLARGAYSLAMVLRFISRNRAVSLLFQYAAMLLSMVYILALVFYYEEHNINPNVKDFWDALYWAALYTITVGAEFSAVTPVGKIISVILPIGGMLVIPLFTVCVTNWIQRFNPAVQVSGSQQNSPADDSDSSENKHG